MKVRKYFPPLALLAGLLVTAACGGADAPPAEPAAETAAPAPAAAGGGPRVFFVEPQDGATVKSPVRLVFGIENYEVSPVPAGTVEAARPGMGHHHVGLDTDCLPTGTVIPMASPWVHFGKGDNQMEMQLPPGPHKLTLQVGDDTHTTIEGLCTTITVNVAE